jgi:hypothetical protein
VELKKEQPRRSDVPINQFLEAEFQATIPKSTLYRHLSERCIRGVLALVVR